MSLVPEQTTPIRDTNANNASFNIEPFRKPEPPLNSDSDFPRPSERRHSSLGKYLAHVTAKLVTMTVLFLFLFLLANRRLQETLVHVGPETTHVLQGPAGRKKHTRLLHVLIINQLDACQIGIFFFFVYSFIGVIWSFLSTKCHLFLTKKKLLNLKMCHTLASNKMCFSLFVCLFFFGASLSPYGTVLTNVIFWSQILRIE